MTRLDDPEEALTERVSDSTPLILPLCHLVAEYTRWDASRLRPGDLVSVFWPGDHENPWRSAHVVAAKCARLPDSCVDWVGGSPQNTSLSTTVDEDVTAAVLVHFNSSPATSRRWIIVSRWEEHHRRRVKKKNMPSGWRGIPESFRAKTKLWNFAVQRMRQSTVLLQPPTRKELLQSSRLPLEPILCEPITLFDEAILDLHVGDRILYHDRPGFVYKREVGLVDPSLSRQCVTTKFRYDSGEELDVILIM